MKPLLKSQFSKEEWTLLKSLRTPAMIQDWLNAIPFNTDPGEGCHSPRVVMRTKKAHCLEGAMFAAAALRVHGHPPLILDLEASGEDEDHVVAIFQQHGCWGAISKTNHAVLRYREPVYKTIRELAMSYFHEYFLQVDGRKTLRAFAKVDLSRFDKYEWMTAEEDPWYIVEHLWDIDHTPLITKPQIKTLRPAEKIEREAGAIIEWK